MIKVEWIDGRMAPVIYCDICGDRIFDCSGGMVFYTSTREQEREGFCKFIYCHKETCSDVAEGQYGCNGWDELSHHLHFLCHNLRLTEDQRDAAQMLNDLCQ